MPVRTMKTQLIRVAFVLAVFALFTPMAGAQVANMQLSPSQVDWMPVGDYESVLLTVSGPEGVYFQQSFAAGEVPGFNLFDQAGQIVPDGTYKFELTTTPRVSVATRRAMDEVNPADRGLLGLRAGDGLVQAGTFRVAGGSIVTDTAALEPGAERAPVAQRAAGQQEIAQRDQVIADDLIVQGSECVGTDCSNGYNFGFDTLVLRENNLRLYFDDTSSSGSFPNIDWRITANDSNNGGSNYLSFDNASANRQIFVIEAGAPANSIVIDSNNDGRVGFGTNAPAVQMHQKDGNTPTLRLEQDGSSGFNSQIWDLAGNEANFFIRDVTNSSKLPFRIKPGAPTDSIYVAADGSVGLGTDSVDDFLHVQRSGSNGGVLIENTTDFAQLSLNEVSTDSMWRFRAANDDFIFVNVDQFTAVPGTSTTPVRIKQGAATNLLVVGGTGSGTPITDQVTINGNLVVTGTITPDYVFEPDYALESIAEHADYMYEKKHLPGVGAAVINEDGKHIINVAQRNDGMLEELEKAHVYIAQLNNSVEAKNQKIEELNALIAQLAERVEAIEASNQ